MDAVATQTENRGRFMLFLEIVVSGAVSKTPPVIKQNPSHRFAVDPCPEALLKRMRNLLGTIVPESSAGKERSGGMRLDEISLISAEVTV